MGPASHKILIINTQIRYMDFSFVNVTGTHDNLQSSCIIDSGNNSILMYWNATFNN